MAYRIKRETRKCINCGSSFECRIDSKKKYCNHKCYWKSLEGKKLKERTEFVCQNCSKSFYKTNKNSKQKFCSRKCYLEDHSKNMREIKCFSCGKEFITSREAKNDKIFCSRKCYLEDHASIMVEFICPICGKIFEQSKGLTDKRLCCSKDCAMKYINTDEDRNNKIGKTLREKYKNGERVSWSKGLTWETDERVRKMSITILEGYQNGRDVHNKGVGNDSLYCDAWKDQEYKDDIMERDNFECQNPFCYHTTFTLCVHHIDYDKGNCHPNNLISLCRSCHGKSNFNRDEWQNFYETGMVVNG